METVKQEVSKLLTRLPDDCSLENPFFLPSPNVSIGDIAHKSDSRLKTSGMTILGNHIFIPICERPAHDCSLEDVQYHLYVLQKIEQGLKDSKEGRVYSQEEVEKRMAKWLGK